MTDHNEFWGPSVWKTLHSVAAAYSPNSDTRSAAISFVTSLQWLLPCEKCQVNYQKKLTAFPIENYLNSNDDFFFWTYMVHDIVNQYAGKKSPPYLTVKNEYFNKLNKVCEGCKVKK